MILRREKRKRVSDRTSSFLVGAFGAKSSTARVGESGQFSPEGLHQRGVIMLTMVNIPLPEPTVKSRLRVVSYKGPQVGDVCGNLTVLSLHRKQFSIGSEIRVVASCLCTCGKIKEIRLDSLRRGQPKSCGCLAPRLTHGLTESPEYKVWESMWTRCTNPNNIRYDFYKGRVPVESWRKFENFISDMGFRPSPKHTLERVDNEKGYSPENCIWILGSEQGKNKTTTRWVTNGQITVCISDACRLIGANPDTIYNRLHKLGWSITRALGPEWSEVPTRFPPKNKVETSVRQPTQD